jgi:hypothetical protein
MIERIKHSTGLLVVVLLVVGFYALSLVVVSYAQATDELYTSVTILSQAPTVTNTTLNNATAISLTEAVSVPITCSGTVSAAGGFSDVSGVTSTIYRSGVTAGCAANDNNCYQAACVTSSGSGTDMHVVCTANLWFHSDSTDASSTWPAEGWQCRITATTVGGLGYGTSAAQELNSLAAESLNPQDIPYGSRAPNSAYTTGPVITTTLYNTGNIIVNTLLRGSSMSDVAALGAPIVATNQYYATTSGGWAAPAQLTASNVLLELGQAGKPTDHTSTSNVTTNIGWGLTVPNGQLPGTYRGTNTSTAISAI